MKKIFALAGLLTTLMAVSTQADIKMNYVKNGLVTTAANYSLAGHCDPAYPLYINGEKINVTEEGFFNYYASLKPGKNVFEFDNTSSKSTYTITRNAVNGSASYSDPFKAVSFIGEVNMDNPTVRSRPDEANDDLITPYVKGTLVRITGENSEYYRTVHDNYLYKSAIDKTNKIYGVNSVKSLSYNNGIVFGMDRPTEYAVLLQSDSIKVILYDTKGIGLGNPNKDMFKNVKYEKDIEGNAVYTFYFTQPGKYIGYKPVFDNKNMTVILNERSELEKGTLKGATIVLDAGHGGEDAGTLGLGDIYEKTVTLSITNMVKDRLESKGAEVVLTRSDDTYVALGTRTAKINEVMPDVAVSIHCNSRNEWEDFGELKGTLDLYTYDSPTAFVENVSQTMNAPYEKNNLALTRISACPAILIETGYMSNPEEYAYLISEAGQKELALKISQAIEKYFGDIQQW